MPQLAARLRHGREVGVEQPALLDVGLDIRRVGGEGRWEWNLMLRLKEFPCFVSVKLKLTRQSESSFASWLNIFNNSSIKRINSTPSGTMPWQLKSSLFLFRFFTSTF